MARCRSAATRTSVSQLHHPHKRASTRERHHMNTVEDVWNDIDWFGIAQKTALALLILLATWIVARLVRWLFAKLTNRVSALQRAGGDGENVGSAIGSVAALLV